MVIGYLKIGELASRTNVSVRTLHYYDEIGLLKPSQQTANGYRLYGAEDAVRLQQIRSLCQLGLPLKKIQVMLAHPSHSPVQVLRAHASQLRARVEAERRLCKRLEEMAGRLESVEEVSLADLLTTLEETNNVTDFKKYYTPEQLESLAKRRDELGDEGMQQGQQDWTDLIAEVQRAVDDGVDAKSEVGRSLAARWDALIEAFTGGDDGIRRSLAKMYEETPDVAAGHGYRPDAKLLAFVEAGRESQT